MRPGIAIFRAFLWLPFGLEDGVADFYAVGDGENSRRLALPSVFKQHRPVRGERLLHCSIIKELAHVLHRYAARRSFFILEPEHAQRAGADVEPRLSLLFIQQVDDVKLEAFLLFLAYESDGRAAFFVAQQRVNAVVML